MARTYSILVGEYRFGDTRNRNQVYGISWFIRSAEPTEYTPVNLLRAVVEVKDLVSLRKT